MRTNQPLPADRTTLLGVESLGILRGFSLDCAPRLTVLLEPSPRGQAARLALRVLAGRQRPRRGLVGVAGREPSAVAALRRRIVLIDSAAAAAAAASAEQPHPVLTLVDLTVPSVDLGGLDLRAALQAGAQVVVACRRLTTELLALATDPADVLALVVAGRVHGVHALHLAPEPTPLARSAQPQQGTSLESPLARSPGSPGISSAPGAPAPATVEVHFRSSGPGTILPWTAELVRLLDAGGAGRVSPLVRMEFLAADRARLLTHDPRSVSLAVAKAAGASLSGLRVWWSDPEINATLALEPPSPTRESSLREAQVTWTPGRARAALLRGAAIALGIVSLCAVPALARAEVRRAVLGPGSLADMLVFAVGGIALPAASVLSAMRLLGHGTVLRAHLDRRVALGEEPFRVGLPAIAGSAVAVALASAIAATAIVSMLRWRLGVPGTALDGIVDALRTGWVVALGGGVWFAFAALVLVHTRRSSWALSLFVVDVIGRILPGHAARVMPSTHVANLLGAMPSRFALQAPPLAQTWSLAILLAMALTFVGVAAWRYRGIARE